MNLDVTAGPNDPYHMVTAQIVDEEVVFHSKDHFEEAMKVGFFRIKAPEDLDLEVGRAFARTFISTPRYNTFGMLNQTTGFQRSDIAQSVRFTLERDNWNKCHVNLEEVEGPPNYPPEIQALGHQMQAIGIKVLRYILKQYELPEHLWFKATAGSSEGEGSHYLLFNCYDPKFGSRPDGLGAHKDWGHITVLDATEPGLEAKIDGAWRSIITEKGFLIVNFGEPLEKLLPGVKASEHRVVTQTKTLRTSTVAFIDPRGGPFRKGVKSEDEEGYVYDWNADTKELVNGQTTVAYFTEMSKRLFGKNY